MVRLTAAKRSALQQQFKGHDKSGDGKLDEREMVKLLKLGNPGLSEAELSSLFNKVDHNGDGSVDFDEFIDYLYGEKVPEAAAAPPEVREVFDLFAGDDCDGVEFQKLCKDCKLIDKQLTPTDVDNLFKKVCPRGKRRIGLSEFEKALCEIASKKGVPNEEIWDLVAAGRKVLTGTEAEYVKFHDDKRSYTGSHAFNETHGSNLGGETEGQRHERLKRSSMSHQGGEELDWGDVEGVFKKFDQEGNGMEGREFKKLCDDVKLYDKKFTKNDVDLVYAKVAAKKLRIDFESFKEIVRIIADKKKCPTAAVQEKIASSAGPTRKSTVAQYTRFHDDKTTFTGTHAQNEAHGEALGGETEAGRHERLKQATAEHTCGDDGDWEDVLAVFEKYDREHNGLDNTEFKKMCEDCKIGLKVNNADIVFSKVAGAGVRKIDFELFKEALRCAADKLGKQIVDLQAMVGASSGPVLRGTDADYVRFHDDKDTYTGMHAGK